MPPIVVIAGQSNAAGRATLPLVPSGFGYATAFAPVQHMYRVEDSPTDPLEWDFDVEPEDLDYIHSGNGTFGIELSLGRRLYRAGYEHAIVKMAIGSSSLAVHWLPTGTFPTGDNLFTEFLAYCAQAETDLSGEIAELIWIQGEADAANEARATAYASNLRAFIEAFRVDFPGVPVTINRLHASCSQTYTATVRAAQDLVARTVPGVRIISADGLPLPDGSHYNTMGFIALGERFADALLEGRAARSGIRSGLRSGSGVRSDIVRAPLFSGGYNFPPVAAFTFADTALEVTFTDASADLEGSIAAWHWDFGDGTIATSQNPTHTYAGAGTYRVTLTATDARGRIGRTSQLVEVQATAWTVDATSGKPTPADGTEWAALVAAESLAVGSPEHLWLFQEASGNLAAVFGGKTLTMTGSPLYKQTETDWSRKFIRASGAAANQFAAASSMAATTEAVAVLVLARTEQPVSGHQRVFYGSASSNAFEGPAGAATMRYRTGTSARNGSTSHAGTVRWYFLIHDPSGTGKMGLYSPLEKLTFDAGTTPAYAARTGTGIQFTFGAAADATAITSIGYAAAWSGSAVQFADIAAMDAAGAALLTALGEPPVW